MTVLQVQSHRGGVGVREVHAEHKLHSEELVGSGERLVREVRVRQSRFHRHRDLLCNLLRVADENFRCHRANSKVNVVEDQLKSFQSKEERKVGWVNGNERKRS